MIGLLPSPHCTIASLVLALMTLSASPSFSQDDPFDRYATRPDQWRPATPAVPGVDARGDLNLEVPVLRVPGRGLGFEVRLTHASGIRYADRGSWVGTGWRFDPGSITRDVFGVLTSTGPANVDFAAAPAVQPDAYYLTVPGMTGTMVRHSGAAGTIRPIRQDSSGFYLTEWRPWRISARTAYPVTVAGQQTLVDLPGATPQLRSDYRRFVVTSDDGTRYVFDNPTLATYYGINTNLAGRTSEQYVATWRLVAILGPYYQGPEIPTGNEPGGWVLLRYGDGTTVGAVISHVAQHVEDRPDGADRLPLGQSMVLMEVVTPTHRAVFDTVPRGLENFATWEQQEAVTLYRRLRSITLYARNTGTAAEDNRVVRRTVLEPAAIGFPSLGNGDRRLALSRIRQFGRGAAPDGQPGPEEPGYWFDYYRMEDEGGDLNTVDDFGYYTTRPRSHGFDGDVDDAKAWSVRSVTYPSGGWDEFEYENDAIVQGNVTYGRFNAGSGSSNTRYYAVGSGRTSQGGVRLVRLRRYDGITEASGTPVPVVTQFAYGTGRLTAPPPLSWTATGYATYRLFTPQERGHAAVYYDYVERRDPDGGHVVTRYTTRSTHAGAREIETVVWDWPHHDHGPSGTTNPGGIRAMAVAQGNQDWAWGHPYEVEYRSPYAVVRRVTRNLAIQGFEPLAAGAVPHLAIAWNLGVNARVEWSYGPRLLQEDERDLGPAGSAGPTTTFAYFDDRGSGYPDASTGNGLPRSMTAVREDGRRRRTVYTYGSEVYAGAGQHLRANRLGSVVREDVLELDAGESIIAYHASTITRWRTVAATLPGQIPFGGTTLFVPFDRYAWQAPQPALSRPAFVAWAGGAPGAEWQRKESHESYDIHGSPLRVLDARGYSTSLWYDVAGRVTRVERETGGGLTLTSSFAYDRHLGLLTMVTDENQGRTAYTYDATGRLSEVRNRSNAVTANFAYVTPREPDGRMHIVRPNRVAVTRWTGATPDRNVSVEFADGLGRPVQTQELDDDGQYVVTGRRYLDAVGGRRVEQVRVPIRLPSAGNYHSHLVWSGPTGFAPGLAEDEPIPTSSVFQNYTETRFTRDGTGRVQATSYPNAGSEPISQLFASYGVASHGDRLYRLTSTYDEAQDRIDAYADGWGHEVRRLQRAHESTSLIGLVTETDYDAMGRALAVRPPNYFAPPHGSPEQWVSRMTYDTQGRLTSRSTPDAGHVMLAYDASGNSRFRQNAEQRHSGTFVAVQYDAFGRATRTGLYSLASAGAASFEGLDPTRPYTAGVWENDATRWLQASSYDQAPSASIAPWSTFAAQIGAFQPTFPRGREVASASRSDGAWQLELSGHDVEERIARRLIHTQDAAGAPALAGYETELRYGYDRQGRLATREVRVGTAGTWFRHWYDYSARGLNSRIYAGTTPARPAVADVTYTHAETGAVGTSRYGSAPALAHIYDARDRLVRIGGTVATGTPAHAFQAEYLHSRDGDLVQAAFYQRHVGAPESRDYFAYCYDEYDRLHFAARVEGGLPDPSTQCDEAWGVTPDTPFSVADLTYDPNGNLLTLGRLDAWGTAVDRLTYSYQPGTNRLASIADVGAGAGTTWDMESGPVANDLNGNVTRLPAPYLITAATYDEHGRLTTATSAGAELHNRYGAAGARYMQRVRPVAIVSDELSPATPRVNAHQASPTAPHVASLAGGDARSRSDQAAADRARRDESARSIDATAPRVAARDAEGEGAVPGRNASTPARRFAPRFAAPADTVPGGAAAGGASAGGASAGGATEYITYRAIDALGVRGPVAVRSASGAVEYNLLTPDGEVVGRQPAAGGRLFDLRDLLGSVRAVVDAPGAVVESRAYDAWGLALAGRTTGAPSAPQGFTGKERDEAAGGPLGGLDDFGARTYAPLLGRFLQTDPAADRFPSWSPYAYTFDRPTSLVDPDGRSPVPPSHSGFPVDDEWRVNSRTGEIERVGIRGGSQTDYYTIGSDRSGGFVAERTFVVPRDDGDINMFRVQYGQDYTISTFHSPGSPLEGFMLEPGGPPTAAPNLDRRIPEGSYALDAYSSTRYPSHFILSNAQVPATRLILIHEGNYPRNTEGCLLPGTDAAERMVRGSRSKLQDIRVHLAGNQRAALNIFEGRHSKNQ